MKGSSGQTMNNSGKEAASTWIAIPVFNHGAELVKLLPRLIGHWRGGILVVDDGSTDVDLGQELKAFPSVALLRHGGNRGKGAALLSAAAHLERLGCKTMITLDSDGQHDPADISRFSRLLEGGFEGVIIGDRDFRGSRAPAASRLGRKLSNLLVFLQTGAWLPDTQSGFRAYPVRTLLDVRCISNRFAFESEIIVRAAWRGVEIRSVGISVDYPAGRISHFRHFTDTIRIASVHLLLLAERMSGRRSRNDSGSQPRIFGSR